MKIKFHFLLLPLHRENTEFIFLLLFLLFDFRSLLSPLVFYMREAFCYTRICIRKVSFLQIEWITCGVTYFSSFIYARAYFPCYIILLLNIWLYTRPLCTSERFISDIISIYSLSIMFQILMFRIYFTHAQNTRTHNIYYNQR